MVSIERIGWIGDYVLGRNLFMWSLLILFLFTAELFFTSSSCPLDMKSHSVLGNNIVATTQHCLC